MDAAYLTLTAARQKNRSQSKWHAGRLVPAIDAYVTRCSGIRVDQGEQKLPRWVPRSERCRAAGCRQAWDAFDASRKADL